MEETDALREGTAVTLRHPAAVGEALMRPRAGEHVLPQPVQAMLSLLRENGVGTYRAAACIAGDENLRQRLVEAAWPARYEDAANYLLDCGNGPPSCSQLGKAEGVALVRCR